MTAVFGGHWSKFINSSGLISRAAATFEANQSREFFQGNRPELYPSSVLWFTPAFSAKLRTV